MFSGLRVGPPTKLREWSGPSKLVSGENAAQRTMTLKDVRAMVACNKRVNEGGSQMTFLTWSFVVRLAKSKPIQYPERQDSSSVLVGQVLFF